MNVASLNALSSPATGTAVERAQLRSAHSGPLTGAALRNAPEAVQRAEVAAQFEAILVRQLLSSTMTSMLGSQSDEAASVYGDLMTDSFAQQLTRGSGLGLAPMLEKQLAPRTAQAAHPRSA